MRALFFVASSFGRFLKSSEASRTILYERDARCIFLRINNKCNRENASNDALDIEFLRG